MKKICLLIFIMLLFITFSCKNKNNDENKDNNPEQQTEDTQPDEGKEDIHECRYFKEVIDADLNLLNCGDELIYMAFVKTVNVLQKGNKL